MRGVRGRTWGMEIKLNRKNSEKEKNGESHPGTHPGPFGYEKKSPKPQKDEEKNPSPGKKGKVKMAKVDSKGIDDENRNERKVKDSAHLRLKRISLLIILGPPPTAESDRTLHKPG
jgi:hypothetical protein